MEKRKVVVLGFVVFLISVFFTSAVYAEGRMYEKGKKTDFSMKVLYKMHLAIVYQDELGLSDEQYKKIKALKIDTKKDLIKRKAEIELLGIDIKSKLSEDSVDIEGINKIIDQKYELKKAKAKALVEVCAKFKGILTAEQNKNLKKIMFKKKQK